jgi:2'-5' RNA ligase
VAKDRLKSPRVRLFVALDLPEPVLDRIVEWQQDAFKERRDLRLTPKYSIHVTLAFLGYQAEKDVEGIAESSFSELPQAFPLRVEDLVEVPPRRPRLYALGVEDAAERLVAWQGELGARLEAAGFYEREKRPFWPHLTIARFKSTERHQKAPRQRAAGRGGAGRAEAAEPLPDDLPEALREPFEAARLTLYRSTLKPQGAVYEPLKRVELGPP